MATITENLQIIKNSTLDIKQAIINKGGTIDGDITTWADSITNIPTGGSGGSSLSKGDVTFYDYDGTVLHSFSKEEFLALNELPLLPTQPGLTCQGWNYNITNAKTYVEEYGKLDIGATYITDDGKTRLYIRIAAEGRMTVPLYFSQTVANGVTIDWGDGSDTQTLSGTGNKNTSHTYASIGDYCITLAPEPNCKLGLGHGSSSYCVMGDTSANGIVYSTMLQKVEMGTGVTSIEFYAFSKCYSLSSLVIPNSVTSIGDYALYYCYSLSSLVIPNSFTEIGQYVFYQCYALSSLVIPNSVTSIEDYAFYNCYSLSSLVIPVSVTLIGNNVFSYCYSLSSLVIPSGVTQIGNNTFRNCNGMAFYDFSNHTSVPTLSNTSVFMSITSDCKIIVPDNLYNTWIAATNWSRYSSNIIKKSDWDAL